MGVMTGDMQDERRPVLVIHGVATRDREGFEHEVEALGVALGPTVRAIPIFWGDYARHADAVDRILPYRGWAAQDDDDGGANQGEDGEALQAIKESITERGFGDFISSLSSGWQRRSEASRHRLLGRLYSRMSDRYLKAAAGFTGDLVLYHDRRSALHAVIWEQVMRHAPGYGLEERPIDVIAHSLGATMMFDLAVSGHPRLHIDNLVSCASQTSFFHAVGASSVSEGPLSATTPIVTLPSSIRTWTNLFVALDPWAFLVGPVFRMHDGSAPEDIELHAEGRLDRVLSHSASHYWTHAVGLEVMRSRLALPDPPEAGKAGG
jgi:hypothetical protein